MMKSSTGLDENVAGLLCYLLFWISGIIFLILEKKNKFVKFHAMQSLIAFAALWILGMVIGWIPLIGDVGSWVIWVITAVLWIFLMVKAYQGEKYELPIAGDIANKIAK